MPIFDTTKSKFLSFFVDKSVVTNFYGKLGSLRRPIVLVNEKRLSNAVRLNLIKECEEIGVKKEEFDRIF